MTTSNRYLAAALAAEAVGLSVMPPKQDGSKMPDTPSWTDYHTRDPKSGLFKARLTPTEIRRFYANGRTGVGAFMGEASGNVELFDFDNRETFDGFLAAAEAVGIGPLVARIRTGYEEETPGGVHWFYRCKEVAGSTKLAIRPTPTKDDPHKRKTLIETKGSGGYAVMAPSNGSVHPEGGVYKLVSGGVQTIATITPDERRAVWDLARTFDEEREEQPAANTQRGASQDGSPDDQPGNIYINRTTWADVLNPHGWTLVHERNGVGYWRRPGKGRGWSATTNSKGTDTFHCFSSSTPFNLSPTSYNRFGAYGVLNHGGDFKAAAKALYQQGYRAPERNATSLCDGDADDGLLTIRTDNQPFDKLVIAALAAITAQNDPPAIFVRGGALVRVCRDEDGRPFISAHTVDSLRLHLATVARWQRAQGRSLVPVSPPTDVTRTLLALGQWSEIPALAGITQTPILHTDGTVHRRTGYDPISGLWYAKPAGFRMPTVSLVPVPEDNTSAVGQIDDVFVDFPFLSEADRATIWAALFTTTLRPLIDGPSPLFIIDKPRAGTGASLLAEVIAVTATGEHAQMKTLAHDRSGEEMRKAITSALLSGSPLIIFDNVDAAIDSGHLAAAITARIWEDRLLGKSEMVRLPVRVSWIATGNNVRVRGDIARRSLVCRLDARVERPWERSDFRHPQLLTYVQQHRGELLAAIFTIARAWMRAGRPAGENPTLGSFEAWSQTVGGMLTYAGVTGLLSNLAEFYAAGDEDYTEWAAFLDGLNRLYKGRAFTVAEVAKVLTTPDVTGCEMLRELVPGKIAMAIERPSLRHSLGRELAGKVEARYDGLRLTKAGITHKVQRWQIIADAPPNCGGPGGSGGSDYHSARES